jgi:hypothetical protein
MESKGTSGKSLNQCYLIRVLMTLYQLPNGESEDVWYIAVMENSGRPATTEFD